MAALQKVSPLKLGVYYKILSAPSSVIDKCFFPFFNLSSLTCFGRSDHLQKDIPIHAETTITM
jgi:hypothetical protein